MASVNRVTILGNIGDDPKIFGTDEKPIVNMSVATSRKTKDRDGNIIDETEWHRVCCFSFQGKYAKQYLKKGDRVYVEGRLHTREFIDKAQVKRYQTEIICENIIGLMPRNDQRQPSQQTQSSSEDDMPW